MVPILRTNDEVEVPSWHCLIHVTWEVAEPAASEKASTVTAAASSSSSSSTTDAAATTAAATTGSGASDGKVSWTHKSLESALLVWSCHRTTPIDHKLRY